jgi:hypothetical protein
MTAMQAIPLNTIDLYVVTAYTMLIFTIGMLVARRTHDADDLYRADAACFIAMLNGALELHFTLITSLIFAVSALINLFASQLLPTPDAKLTARYRWRPVRSHPLVALRW